MLRTVCIRPCSTTRAAPLGSFNERTIPVPPERRPLPCGGSAASPPVRARPGWRVCPACGKPRKYCKGYANTPVAAPSAPGRQGCSPPCRAAPELSLGAAPDSSARGTGADSATAARVDPAKTLSRASYGCQTFDREDLLTSPPACGLPNRSQAAYNTASWGSCRRCPEAGSAPLRRTIHSQNKRPPFDFFTLIFPVRGLRPGPVKRLEKKGVVAQVVLPVRQGTMLAARVFLALLLGCKPSVLAACSRCLGGNGAGCSALSRDACSDAHPLSAEASAHRRGPLSGRAETG